MKTPRKRFTERMVLFMVAILWAGLFSACGKLAAAEPLSNITYFSYSGIRGSMANSNYSYRAELKDDQAEIYLKESNTDEEYTFTTSADFFEKLTEIANTWEVSRWDGFDKNNKNVMDGNSFSLNIKTQSGQSVEARGYMKYPENHSEAIAEIMALFEGVRPNA